MGTRQFDAATLFRAAGVNLRFYDYGKSEFTSRRLGLLDGAGNPAPWDFDIERRNSSFADTRESSYLILKSLIQKTKRECKSASCKMQVGHVSLIA
jgi:hypothetical protein